MRSVFVCNFVTEAYTFLLTGDMRLITTTKFLENNSLLIGNVHVCYSNFTARFSLRIIHISLII